MCKLFPTEVACYIRIGATTGDIHMTNYLSNNLFNRMYFHVLWLWWCALIGISVLGFIYRFAQIMMPDLFGSIWMRKVRAWRLENS